MDFYIGANRRRISFQEYELDLLYRVFKSRLLTTSQMYRWIGAEDRLYYESFCYRLSKLTENSILERRVYPLGQKGFRYNYYGIGTKGKEVLLSSGYITPDTKLYDQYRVIGSNQLDHYLATQEVVISTLLRLKSEGVEGVEDYSPYDYPYLDGTADSPDKKYVVPDWIMKKGDTFLNIELDTGTEKLEMIQEKVQGYIRLANSRQTENHIVLFVVLDDSFPSRHSYSDRYRRIGNMKQSLVNSRDIQTPNLDVYVVSLSRASDFAYRLLINQSPYDAGRKFLEVEAAVTLLGKYNPAFEYQFTELELESFYPPSIPFYYHADGIYKLSNQAGSFSEMVMFLVLEEGYVQALDKLDFLYKSAFQFNSFQKKIDRMIVLYDSQTALQSDILGAEFPNVLFIDGPTVGSSVGKEPIFYKQTSPYRMEVTTYDKSR